MKRASYLADQTFLHLRSRLNADILSLLSREMSQDMSRSNSQDRPRSQGRTYTDEEWERVRRPFYHFYIEKNLSLKESARRMAEDYNFDATLRQWERRIAPEKWNFPKYASRDDRLKLIQDSGKTLLEVGSRGRRKSTASDGRPPLNEDRNLRRFARRELSREPRPRARSVSAVSDGSDQEMTGTSAAPSPAASDYNAMESQGNTPFPSHDLDDPNESWNSGTYHSQTPLAPRIEIYDHSANREDFNVPTITLSGPRDLTHIAPDTIPIATQSQVNVHYPQNHGDDEDFVSYQREASTLYDPHFENNVAMPPSLDMHDSWHNQNPFVAASSKPSDVLPEFDFNQISFEQLMHDQNHTQSSHTSMNDQLEAFNNESLQLQEDMSPPLASEEAMPEFDNTHADVHNLLREHFQTTLQMIRGCLQGCQNVSGHDNEMKRVIMRHLQLLETHIQANSKFEDLAADTANDYDR